MAGRGRLLHVALMRGINVGGKNRLPMRDLAAIFEDAGCEEVRTYIQSGNVVFAASAALAKSVGAKVEEAVLQEHGIRSPVVTRSARELAVVISGVPFKGNGAEESALHVVFLAKKPGASAVKGLDPERSPGDSFRVVGREIFLSLPNGAARTKLTNDYFDRTLGTVSTVRNWRTVLKLGEMVGV
jgi:uncharacterized protein (DUF1697 family)